MRGGRRWLADFIQDLRHGARLLLKSPGFVVAAVLTLALGIGANTAIFSITQAVLLRALPYRDPEGLVKVTFNNRGVGQIGVPFSVPELDDLRSRSDIFEDVSATWSASVNLTGGKEPERLELLVTSPGYFSMLGAKPQIGRLIGAQDTAAGFAPVVVLSDRVWRTSYGGDPRVLGRTLRLDNDPYVIVGVLPPCFRHPGKTVAGDVDIWATAGYSADPFPTPARNARLIPGAIGRLMAGLTPQEAQARLDLLAARLRSEFPGSYPEAGRFSIEVQPLRDSLVGAVRPMLLLLSAATGVIVLIVVVNIANLLMARSAARRREFAIRLALGAGRGRIIRQLLTESLILSAVAGAAGVAATAWLFDSGLQFVPQSIPRLSEVRLDGAVFLFALAVSVLTALAFGLVPALQSVKVDLSAAIREAARGSGGGSRATRVRRLLTVAQVSLAVLLMVGAGLLLLTLRGLLMEHPGFDPAQLVTASIWLPVPNDPKADPYGGIGPQAIFGREVLRRMHTLRGVRSAAITSSLPETGDANNFTLAIEDDPVGAQNNLTVEAIRVSPEYFQVMRTPVVHGRSFAEDDAAGKVPVALIDETTARLYWGGRDPIGRRIKIGSAANSPWSTIVGIVGNVRHDGLDVDGVPHVYVPLYQRQGRVLTVVLRTDLPAATIEPQIRREIQSVDPGLPVFNVRSMNAVIDASLASRRFSADLVGAFAGLALLLAALGIYGLLAFLTAQRTPEIGLRMALGARAADIRRMILGDGLRLAGAGILAGLVLAAAAAPLMASLVYGVRVHDATLFVAVPAILMAVALAASCIPARRAARINPIAVLRED